MAKRPTRIDLLELDIDLRLSDLWREAGEITDWNIDVVAAFMRAAYGKGYCDALTEDAPGVAGELARPQRRCPASRERGVDEEDRQDPRDRERDDEPRRAPFPAHDGQFRRLRFA